VAQGDLTHVVLSFGSREGGGAMFAQWLRREIKGAKALAKENNVYLDTEGLAALPEVTPDLRDVEL